MVECQRGVITRCRPAQAGAAGEERGEPVEAPERPKPAARE